MHRAPPLPPNAALRWSVVKPIVRRLAPATILEVGCGQGAFGARLARQAAYLAIEPDPGSFAVATRRIESAGGQVRNIDSDALEPGRMFDLLCAFEVLEHLEDDVATLKTWLKFVSPGGHVLVSMPAWQSRFNHWDAMVGHFRRYSPDQCRQLLTTAGFQDVQVVVYGWPLGYVTENVRSQIAARRGRAGSEDGHSMRERTARSGRLLQPRTAAGTAIQLATLPFAGVQRMMPGRGTGVVALGTRPR